MSRGCLKTNATGMESFIVIEEVIIKVIAMTKKQDDLVTLMAAAVVMDCP